MKIFNSILCFELSTYFSIFSCQLNFSAISGITFELHCVHWFLDLAHCYSLLFIRSGPLQLFSQMERASSTNASSPNSNLAHLISYAERSPFILVIYEGVLVELHLCCLLFALLLSLSMAIIFLLTEEPNPSDDKELDDT